MKADTRLLGRNRLGVAGNKNAEPGEQGNAVDDRPRSVYEIMTRQMLEELKDDVSEVKGRINTLLWLVVGAVVLEVVMRVIR